MSTGIIKIKDLNISNYDEVLNRKRGFLNYNNKSYFYKRSLSDLAYRELIAHEIASLFNIPATYYKIIEFPDNEFGTNLGVITKDYRDNNKKFIEGYFILRDFNNEFLHNWSNNDRENNHNFNNLENIWEALNYRYRFLENKEEVVNILFGQIVFNLFIFDIFVSNADRHFHNWEVVDFDYKNKFYLNKIYDNEDIFLKDYKIPEIAVSKSTNQYDFYDTLREFLNITENKYIEQVKLIYNCLTPNILIKIIDLTEKKHKITIPLFLKEEIIKKYDNHYNNISKVLREYTEKEKKKILHK